MWSILPSIWPDLVDEGAGIDRNGLFVVTVLQSCCSEFGEIHCPGGKGLPTLCVNLSVCMFLDLLSHFDVVLGERASVEDSGWKAERKAVE